MESHKKKNCQDNNRFCKNDCSGEHKNLGQRVPDKRKFYVHANIDKKNHRKKIADGPYFGKNMIMLERLGKKDACYKNAD